MDRQVLFLFLKNNRHAVYIVSHFITRRIVEGRGWMLDIQEIGPNPGSLSKRLNTGRSWTQDTCLLPRAVFGGVSLSDCPIHDHHLGGF